MTGPRRWGTDCQIQPEVHAITQALRAEARITCPAVVFKAEAIGAPTQLVQYPGQGSHHSKVSDIAYHNSLMVQVWSTLATGDVTLAVRALENLPPEPSTAAWVTYTRCHDDIGWAISDEDAAAARVRAGIPALHAAVEAHVLPLHGSGVLPVIRRHPMGTHVGLYSVTEDWRPYPAREVLGPGARETLHDAQLVPDPQGLVWLPPLTGWWIVRDPS